MHYNTITEQLIAVAFKTGSINIRPEKSVICTSPVDLNIQKFTADYGPTNLVLRAMKEKIEQISLGKDAIIVGITFEGIPTGKLLAHQTEHTFYALKRDSENIPGVKNLWGKDVLIVTGTVATGKTLGESADVIYKANGKCNHAITIFSKEFCMAKKLFTGEERVSSGGRGGTKYDKQLPEENRIIHSLITPTDISCFIENENNETYTSREQRELLKNWVIKNSERKDAVV